MSYHPTKLGGHSHSGSGAIMVLIYNVISPDDVINASCNFMGRRQSR